MTKINNVIWFKDSLSAWENINEMFLRHDYELGATIHAHALYVYDCTIGIRKPKLDPEFDFGKHFNYTISKWNNSKSHTSRLVTSEALKNTFIVGLLSLALLENTIDSKQFLP